MVTNLATGCLKKFADILKNFTGIGYQRPDGGDEFFAGSNARLMTKHIPQTGTASVSRLPLKSFYLGGVIVSVTASFGIAGFPMQRAS